ncbi:type IV pilus assembly protein PilM [Candidatus Saccharibacteria bacterium]|nr:type IV pilus assembly protein PilM [Candidatus Saccharibacteria bacterium]
MKSSIQPLFYKDRPVFGLDIGFNTIKAIQLDASKSRTKVLGYGFTNFDNSVFDDGAIKDHKKLAKAVSELFNNHIIGQINTRRVIATVASAKAYSRVINQPANLSKKELEEAITLEAAQYIPIPLDDLYLEYSIVKNSKESIDILIVGVPKKIIDSYVDFFKIIGLELCAIETTTLAASRLISKTENSNGIPTILIDLGSLSVDVTVFDNNSVVNSTIPGGGDDFSQKIAERLQVSKDEADEIKTKYGLGVSRFQSEIREALKPQLDSLTKEIRRVVRYYAEKTNHKASIDQIITMGGGSNMPGLVDYLTDNIRIATRLCDFWGSFDTNNIQIPPEEEKSLYVTAAGSAIVSPKDIWK